MPTLAPELRRQLEDVVTQTRAHAETAARAALRGRHHERHAEELAYAAWQQLLFAHFLAAAGLPPTDAAEIALAAADRQTLADLLASLPPAVFAAEDGLGWAYQCWQTQRRRAVNGSSAKIDGRSLPAVTQLFSEPYMVRFLLHNTLGAWWCARHGRREPPGALEYLRDRPTADSFATWPQSLRDFTLLDPCCGSGHFLIAALHLLVPLRRHTEELTARQACDAVLRENLFGLEIDPRCADVAACALALAAWKYPDEDGQPLGYRALPLHIACCGERRPSLAAWLAPAGGERRLRHELTRLHELFAQAAELGSLLDPGAVSEELRPLLQTPPRETPAAGGLMTAIEMLGRRYTLVATNVPYLGRGKQAEPLQAYAERRYPLARADLAAVFLERCLELAAPGGTAALVLPQTLLFLHSFRALRQSLLRQHTWDFVARLGPGAFEMISGENVNVALVALTRAAPQAAHRFTDLDVGVAIGPTAKAAALRQAPLVAVSQAAQLDNPGARVTGQSVTAAVGPVQRG